MVSIEAYRHTIRRKKIINITVLKVPFKAYNLTTGRKITINAIVSYSSYGSLQKPSFLLNELNLLISYCIGNITKLYIINVLMFSARTTFGSHCAMFSAWLSGLFSC